MICQSGRACPGAWTALRTRCTRRSLLVKVPSFSAKQVAGRTTSASFAVSLMKISCTSRKSSFSRLSMTFAWFGSLRTGSSPRT